ncbi:MFS transporter [Vallitalea okinawensis]|uniref:MFS transporter n=1 Tax=Vallitalea okinawensis TaxID=2078660 RepID=UPI000CFE3070|nr:MFS transporter [Vallitalea okinawensis]
MSKHAKILLIVSALFTMAMGLSNVFVNILLWKESSDFVLIAKYQLMHFIFTPLAFIVAGKLSKRKNGIWALRIGILLFAVFFLFILLSGDSIIDYIYPFGILFGVAGGFYWLAFHVLSFDFTATDNRDTFNGFNGFIASGAGSVAPLIAAYIIEKSEGTRGYFIVFLISLVLFVIQILVSLTMKTKHYGETLNIKKVIGKNGEEWTNLRNAVSAWGLRDVIIMFIITILIYETTGSEMSLGILVFVAGLVTCGAFLLEQKIIKPKRRLFSMHLGAIFLFVSVLGLVFDINYMFLIIFMIVNGLFMPFFLVPMVSATFNTLNRNHEEDYRIEYIINKEIALNFGRVVSTLILICLLTFFENEKILNYFLIFIGAAQFISLFFLRRVKTWDS